MANFKIVSDSSCDLPQSIKDAYDIHIVPYYVTLDGENYKREGIEISIREFYHALRTQKIYPKTSLPTTEDYLSAFRPIASQGHDVLCLCLTSKFSGSYQCAVNAMEAIKEEFPERVVYVIDTQQVTATEGILVVEAAKKREAGATITETRDYIESIKGKLKVVFTVNALDYLERGGRIGKASAFAGNLFNIKPIIAFYDGELHPLSKVRGRKKAVAGMIDYLLKDMALVKGDLSQCWMAMLHSDELEEAKEIEAMLKESYGYNFILPPIDVGVTIGTHIGPTVVGVAYYRP